MNRVHNCKSSFLNKGNFYSIDIIERISIIPELYKTIRIKTGYASWQCDQCGYIQKQKLRVSKKTESNNE